MPPAETACTSESGASRSAVTYSAQPASPAVKPTSQRGFANSDAERQDRAPHRERRQRRDACRAAGGSSSSGRRRRQRQPEPGGHAAGHARSRPQKGRYDSAASAATPIRGRSRRRSKTTKRRSQLGKNLPLKWSRLSSWNRPFSASKARRSRRCSPCSSASGARSAANGREVQRDAREAVLAGPVDGLADQPLVEAVRRRPQPGHRRERQRCARGDDSEVEEAHGRHPTGLVRRRTRRPRPRAGRARRAPSRSPAAAPRRATSRAIPSSSARTARPRSRGDAAPPSGSPRVAAGETDWRTLRIAARRARTSPTSRTASSPW